jgi:hypothetical protein
MANGVTKNRMLIGLTSDGTRIESDRHQTADNKYVVDMYDGDTIWFRPPTEEDLHDLEMTEPDEAVVVLSRGDDYQLYRALHVIVVARSKMG